jgi:hypothetical protein
LGVIEQRREISEGVLYAEAQPSKHMYPPRLDFWRVALRAHINVIPGDIED